MKPSFLAAAMSMLALTGSNANAEQVNTIKLQPVLNHHIESRRGGNSGYLPASYRKTNQRKVRKNTRRAIAAGFKP